MREYRKKEILGTLAALIKINDISWENGNGLAGMDFGETLAWCQERAIQLGNFLETFGTSMERQVHILEGYCENLYQMSIFPDDMIRRRKLAKKIRKQLTELNSGLRYGLPEGRQEIVFLPYKASMWDSMESLWLEETKDAGKEVFVVPIPYFDKNPDGTLGQEHYEGDAYPEYVPVVPWQEYNISEHRPDVIYIHNPYDECNYITSVLPEHYAANLRKYTDMLVYTPYFVAMNDEVQEHFCILPGVIYAHKVIVQSEKVRRIYMKELQQYEKENKLAGRLGNIEEKIVVHENPKLIKARAVRREDYDLPEAWKAWVEREDGSRKKIIFYNTTIGAMLKYNDTMLAKIEKVIRTFQCHNEVALLWRPHPLLKATLGAMRPELLERFEQLEKLYQEEGVGIYDESADLYRAIAWADAYYGDPSSVVELFKETGKPIMIESMEI